MENQVLTIEQMRELIDMGIDVSKASIYWSVNKVNARGRKSDLMPPFLTFHKNNQVVGFASFEYIPTFTLQDILEMLPKNIDRHIPLDMQSYGKPYNVINFGYWRGERLGWLKFCKDMHSTLNSAFELLKWCKENNFI